MNDLDKRAKEYAIGMWGNDEAFIDERGDCYQTYIEATQRETSILSKHIVELQADKGRLTDKVKKLEKEINNYKLAEIEAKEIMAELEEKLANADYQLEGRDLEIKELQDKLGDVQMQKAGEKSDLVWKLKTANEQKADQLIKAKQFIRDFLSVVIDYIDKEDKNYSYVEEGWKFLNEVDE